MNKKETFEEIFEKILKQLDLISSREGQILERLDRIIEHGIKVTVDGGSIDINYV